MPCYLICLQVKFFESKDSNLFLDDESLSSKKNRGPFMVLSKCFFLEWCSFNKYHTGMTKNRADR